MTAAVVTLEKVLSDDGANCATSEAMVELVITAG
jgi:hypothetical protein